MSREVVVTGLGVIVGNTYGKVALRELLAGTEMHTSIVEPLPGHTATDVPRHAVLSTNVDLSEFLLPLAGRRMSALSQWAVTAALMSMADAKIETTEQDLRTAIVLSSCFGSVSSIKALLDAVHKDGPQAVSPFAFAESVANAAAGQVAIATQSKGPNITIVQRETGSITAVGRGAALVASGQVDRAFVGSADEMSPLLYALLGKFDALAAPGRNGIETARPFDANRNGFIASEGAAILLLESLEAAQSRCVTPVARVRSFSGAFDPSAPRVGWGSGSEQLGGSLQRFIHRAGYKPSDIARIVSGASGAIDGDRMEANVLKSAWGRSTLPPILTPKAYVGEYGGGFLAAATISLAGGRFGATPGFEAIDPELGICPFGGGTLEPDGLSLWTTVGSGGSAAWLLVESG